MIATSFSDPLRPNEGERTVFPLLDRSRVLKVQSGCLTREEGDAIIVSTNTAFSPSGALGTVLDLLSRGRGRLSHSEICRLLFPHVTIVDPLPLRPGEVLFDERLRPCVGELGSAIASVRLSDCGITLPQKWKHVIIGFVRHQSSPISDSSTDGPIVADVTASSVHKSLELAVTLGLRSVVTVAFGAGFAGVSAGESSQAMVPSIVDLLKSKENTCLEQVTVVLDYPGQYAAFAREAKSIIGKQP